MSQGSFGLTSGGNSSSKRDWENQFHLWGSGPAKREMNRCEAAVKEVRDAINGSAKLAMRKVRVFPQGSLRNRVNVRVDSDVDVGIECEDAYFTDSGGPAMSARYGSLPSSYTFDQFKTEVGEALIAHFGWAAVTRGNKAFDIKATQKQVAADVAPFFQHRRLKADGSYHQGVEMRTDSGERVINWPEQHYSSGVDKHGRTEDRFKKIVRIVKSLRNEMDAKGIWAAGPIPTFLIECLVFNAPNHLFGNPKWFDDVAGVLAYLRENTAQDALCKEWVEVSGYKWLFSTDQKWTRPQAHEFLKAAEKYIA